MKIILEFVKDNIWDIYKKSIFYIFVITIITTLCSLLNPIFSKLAFDIIITSENMKLLNLLMGLFLVIILVGVLFSLVRVKISIALTQKTSVILRHKLFDKIYKFTWDELDKYSTGELQFRLFNDITLLSEVAAPYIFNLSLNVLILVVVLTALTIYKLYIGFCLIFVLGLYLIIYTYLQKKIAVATEKVQSAGGNIYGFTQEQLERINLAQMYNNEIGERRNFFRNIRFLSKEVLNLGIITSYSGIFYSIVASLAVLLFLWVGAWEYYHKNITIGDLIAYLSLLSILMPLVTTIGNMIINLPKVEVGVNRFNELYKSTGVIDYAGHNLKHIKGNICLKNVSYNGLINDKTFNIVANRFNLIKGPSGAGKTTICRLILKAISPDIGNITIDGEDIKNINIKTLRKQAGYIPTRTHLINGTVLNNLFYGLKGCSVNDAEKALIFAELYDTVQLMPDSYFSFVGRNGIILSEGEKQRLAIARLYLWNPQIWILDEALSSVDMETEEKILQKIASMKKDKTIVVISHRENIEKYADNIIHINKNEVVSIDYK